MTYKSTGVQQYGAIKYIQPTHPQYANSGLMINAASPYFLGCCGLRGIQGFGAVAHSNWQDTAEWMAALYREAYAQGFMVYCISNSQLKNAGHLALVSIGSRQIAEFPNLYHGPQMLSLWLVNIRDACGRYCDLYGDAYKEPPKDDSEVVVTSMEARPIAGGYAYAALPVKPQFV